MHCLICYWEWTGWIPSCFTEDRYNDEERNYVTAVAVSICGSYGFAGSNGGHLYRYNMQSGAPSGTFPHSDGK